MPFWGVVRSQTQRERFAAEQLEHRGFETFLPLIETKRATQPLFASYFFIRIESQWQVINRTFGVLCLVRVGDCPAKCPDAEIARLKAMTDGHGYIRLPALPTVAPRRIIAKGAPVTIAGGPFKGFAGLYQGMSRRDRELVLLDLLGRQTTVEIAAALVVPRIE
jgi:transcriptional antiterminator RfaH